MSRTTAVVDALNQQYAFSYDALGRQTQMTRASVSMSYAYDAVGNRTARTDYNGATTNYTYDDLNRLTTIAYPGNTSATYNYDALSRLTTAVNVNGTVSFSYDNRNRLTSTTDVFDQTIAYSYDPNGNRTAMTLNGSLYAGYAYDTLNRLTQLSDSSAVAATYAYDAVSKPAARTLLNGVVSTYEYDGLDRLTRLRDKKATTTVLDNQYVYNTASQIVEKTTPGATQNFDYDVTDRLTSVVSDGSQTESYTYDAVGNRTSSLGGSLTYGPFNRLASMGGSSNWHENKSYSYDNNGNLIGGPFCQTCLISAQEKQATYSYDFENRLTEAVEGWLGALFFGWNYTTVNYQYDALGRRVARSTSNGEVQKFVYDGQDVIQDLDSSGQVITSYLNGPGIDNKLRQTDASGSLYYSADHLGSTRALTAGDGSLLEQIDYDSFGNSSGSSLTRYAYTGREFDPDTGLLYYRARFYDPQVGRFISEDPIGFSGGVNAYGYVENNPLRFTDPSGLCPQSSAGQRCDDRLAGIFGGDGAQFATDRDPNTLSVGAGRNRLLDPTESPVNGHAHIYATTTGAGVAGGNLFTPKGWSREERDYYYRESHTHKPANDFDELQNYHRFIYLPGSLQRFGYSGGLTISFVHSGPTNGLGMPSRAIATHKPGSVLVGTIGNFDGVDVGGSDPRYVHSHLNFYNADSRGRTGAAIDPRRVFCHDLGF